MPSPIPGFTTAGQPTSAVIIDLDAERAARRPQPPAYLTLWLLGPVFLAAGFAWGLINSIEEP